jgi:hypothetical protein
MAFSFAAMLKKRIISIVLVMVFAIPIIPVIQVGGLLYQNQLTEEMSGHSISIVKQGGETEHFTQQINLPFSVLVLVSAAPIIIDEKFMSRHADDIQTPPPNA